MKAKNYSVGMFPLIVLMVVCAFVLMSLKNPEAFDITALIAGGVLISLMSAHYFLLRKLVAAIDRQIMLIVYTLISISMIMQYRINSDIALRQLTFIAIGMALMLITVILMRNFDFWKRFTIFFMIGGVVLIGLALVIGITSGGAKNWVSIGGFSFQPSEFSKILLILVMAYYLSESQKLSKLIIPFAFAVASMGILVLSRDLGAALIYAMTVLMLYYVATGNLYITGAGLLAGAGAATMGYALFDHVKIRVAAWRNPFASYLTNGYQIAQGLMAIASGGFFGMGLTMGKPKLIPAYHTDFIFAVICEEMGIIVGLCVIAFYLVLVVRSLGIARRCEDSYSALITAGAAIVIGVQTFLIIGGVIKLIPLTGVTMPFVSYGGSSITVSFILIGMIQAANIKNKESGK